MNRCYIILRDAVEPLTEREIRKRFNREASLNWDLNALVHNGVIRRFREGRSYKYEVKSND